MSPQEDPVLRRLRAALEAEYGSRLKRVVLFGSRARGDAHADSDYDVAVFLDRPGPLWEELGRLAPIVTDIAADTGEMVSAKPFPAEAWENGTSLLMREIRREGLPL
ncbi:nucleotidyltransferase domain-containing protein [Siccirubricoccus phaeus]|uniref:nucleotidyltransferase domain-containing protein n=1 Tax=Siccirubricoccus phaeus TaxID=2595053 RepID=UPI0011F3BEB5|nr:nucleotidyltransferase domain-containing protein [Siccirubricoccus phaeus]